MDAPAIQYCKTSDGVSIAYWELGQGPPLIIITPLGYSHIALEWDLLPLRQWYQRLARERTVVRYDPRCSGLSDRGVEDMSERGQELDIEAVVNHLGADRYDLLGVGGPGSLAAHHAALDPDRVDRLILVSALTRYADLWAGGEQDALVALVRSDWQMYCESWARLLMGWASGIEAHELATFAAASQRQEDAVRSFEAIKTFDITALLPSVRAQTLVVDYPMGRWTASEPSRVIASHIPNAKLVTMREAGWPFRNERFQQVVEEFLGLAPLPGTDGESSLPSGTAIILFLDIAGSTELTTKLGDAAYREKERQLDGALRQAIREAGGSPVEGKVLGDGVMATFGSASNAIGAALHCQALGESAGLPLHAGIHAGDVTREGNNVHGGAVQVAARIADVSAAGEVIVSQTVRDLARTSAGVSFEDRGEHDLKGVSERVRVYSVREEST